MSISSKVRFEILKRDKFTCQYCGRTAPEVALQIDHIQPASKGGLDDTLNLITSCRECNSGKGAELPSLDTINKLIELDLGSYQDFQDYLNGAYDFSDPPEGWIEEFNARVKERMHGQKAV